MTNSLFYQAIQPFYWRLRDYNYLLNDKDIQSVISKVEENPQLLALVNVFSKRGKIPLTDWYPLFKAAILDEEQTRIRETTVNQPKEKEQGKVEKPEFKKQELKQPEFKKQELQQQEAKKPESILKPDFKPQVLVIALILIAIAFVLFFIMVRK